MRPFESGVVFVVVLLVGCCESAAGQSRAVMVPNGPVIVELSFFAETDLGNFVGSDVIGIGAFDAGAVMTLFGNESPFSHCTVHGFDLALPTVDGVYLILFGASEIRIRLSGLTISAEGPDNSAIGADGAVAFANMATVVSGTIRITEDLFFGMDVTETFEADVVPTKGLVHEQGGTVDFTLTAGPIVSNEVELRLLPVSVFSFSYAIDIVSFGFSGPHAAAYGDSDADGVVGLSDFDDLASCVSGAGVEADIYCLIFDFDKDDDVDLVDFGAFQGAFDSGP